MSDEDSVDCKVAKAFATANFLRREPHRKQALIDDFTKLPSRYYAADNEEVEQTGAAKAQAFRMSFVRSSAAALIDVCRDQPAPSPRSTSFNARSARGDGGADSLSSFMDTASPGNSPMPSPRGRGGDGHTLTSKHGLVNYSVHDGSQRKTRSCTSTASLFAKLRSLSIRRDEDLPGLGPEAGGSDDDDSGFESVSVGKALQRLPSHLSTPRSPRPGPGAADDPAPSGTLSRQPSKRCLKSTASNSFAYRAHAPHSPDSALAFESAGLSESAPPAAGMLLRATSSKRALSFARTTSLGTSLEQPLGAAAFGDADDDAAPPAAGARGGALVPPLPLKHVLSFASHSSSSAALDCGSPRGGADLQRCPSVRSPGTSALHRSTSVRSPLTDDGLCGAGPDEPLDGILKRESSGDRPMHMQRQPSQKRVTLGFADECGGGGGGGGGGEGGASFFRRSGSMLDPPGTGGGSSFVEDATRLLQRCAPAKRPPPLSLPPGAGAGAGAPPEQEQQHHSPAAAGPPVAARRMPSLNSPGARGSLRLPSSRSISTDQIPASSAHQLDESAFSNALRSLQDELSPRRSRRSPGDADMQRSHTESSSGASPRGGLTRLSSTRHAEGTCLLRRGMSCSESALPGGGGGGGPPLAAVQRSLSIMRRGSTSVDASPPLSPLPPPGSPREQRGRMCHTHSHGQGQGEAFAG